MRRVTCDISTGGKHLVVNVSAVFGYRRITDDDVVPGQLHLPHTDARHHQQKLIITRKVPMRLTDDIRVRFMTTEKLGHNPHQPGAVSLGIRIINRASFRCCRLEVVRDLAHGIDSHACRNDSNHRHDGRHRILWLCKQLYQITVLPDILRPVR